MKHTRFLSIIPLLFSLNCCDLFLPPPIIPNTTQETTEEETQQPVQRHDLASAIYFNDYYRVGDKFDFSGTIQNTTKNEIYLSNSIDKNCLEYRIMNNDGEYFKINPSNHNFEITLFEQGIIKAQHKNDILTSRYSNIKATIDGKEYYIIGTYITGNPPTLKPLEIEISMPLVQPTLDKVGEYWLDVLVRYQMNEESYETKFTSEKFEVLE